MMFGIVKEVQKERGIVWITVVGGFQGGTVPAIMDGEACAKFTVGQRVTFGEGILAISVRAPHAHEIPGSIQF